MLGANLRDLREHREWNQLDLARHLGVSQTLVSLWEHGERKIPKNRLQQLRELGMKVNAVDLPLRDKVGLGNLDYAQELSNLGYPGYAHFQSNEPSWNPAQLLIKALAEENLDRRVAEGLPWLVLRYPEMNWNWVRREARLSNLQNRLGFTIALARRLAIQKKERELATRLGREEECLRESLLAKEDTYCYERMTQAERKWLHTRRSPDATAWRVLSDLLPENLTHA